MKFWNEYTRGVNLGGWLSQCVHSPEHYESFITQKDIETLGSWGLDHVRLPIDYEVMGGEGGFQLIDSCIEWCAKNGLNIILDLHKAPGYSFTTAGGNSLFDDPDLQDQFIGIWREMASRYSRYGEHVAFELLNEIVEPNCTRWNALAKRAIAEIRKCAPHVKIVIGSIQWNSVHTLHLLDQPYDENIVYTFHFYEPFLFTHQKAGWVEQMPKTGIEYPGELSEYRRVSSEVQAFGSGLYSPGVDRMGTGFLRNLIQEAIHVAEDRNVYLYCGEYGVIRYAPPESILNWYTDMNSVFEEFKIGRAAWTYKSNSFGISNEYEGSIRKGIVSRL